MASPKAHQFWRALLGRTLGLFGVFPTRARGGEGALAPSQRVPHGHDQTQEILQLLSFFFQKFELQQLQLGQNIKIGCKSHFARIAAAATRKKKQRNWWTCGSRNSPKIWKIGPKDSSCGNRNSKKKIDQRKRIKQTIIKIQKWTCDSRTSTTDHTNKSNGLVIATDTVTGNCWVTNRLERDKIWDKMIRREKPLWKTSVSTRGMSKRWTINCEMNSETRRLNVMMMLLLL